MRTPLSLILSGALVATLTCNGQAPPPRTTTPTRRTAPPPERRPSRAAPKSVQLTKETTLKSPSGATVIVPARWHVTHHPGYFVLQEPDRGLWLALTEARAKNGKAAISAAWQRIRPGFSLKVLKTISPPARDGWEDITQITYQTPTRSRRVVLGVARGKGRSFYVALLDGKISALARRGAQLTTVLSSLKAPGVQEESWAGKKAHVLDAGRLKALETFLEDARKKLKVPGTAVAIVQQGRVIFQKGFGVRKKGRPQRVTPRTIFMIGSMTKALTTFMMAKMVDEKRFTWETTVTRVMPSFRLGDAAATRKCQMQHTVCACTGLPRQDMEFLFEFKGKTAASRLKLLATMKPTTRFGETFQYSNMLVAAGGYVAARAAYPRLKLDRAYRKAMQTRLFGPVGMKSTTFDKRRVRRLNHAWPHSADFKNVRLAIPLAYEGAVDSVGPAGAAWSNVGDMARYILTELGRGKAPSGRQVVSKDNLLRRWKPYARVADKVHYGLAVMINQRRGVRIIGHGGGTLGFTSYMLWLPDHDVGLVVLTNCMGCGSFTGLLKRRFLEILFDGRPDAARSLAFTLEQQNKNLTKSLKQMDLQPKAAWLKRFVGTYHNAGLGRITLSVGKGRGIFDAGEWKTTFVKRTEKDGVEKLVIGPPLTGLPFLPGKQGKLRTLTLHTGQQRYVFIERKR